ncbi:hypothetical protein DdX_16455 [Ditylenchus destructor]|uniref:Uncharacterized protein n=1 Tax=Ditylenchus destructor TaxID=166010 RepID=A0AAD4QW96_9BILA|nr:hypothetical protein DdX_20754 [Ditylenchus destructor]KAI1700834.1 hypothetical protein DdX_16455 [Ditylenchus destructor]
MVSATVLGVKIHHWAYAVTLLLFLRCVLDAVLGFTWNILLLVCAFLTTMILLIALGALSNHGTGVYRVFFVFYFLRLTATFFALLIGLILLRTGRAAADFGYNTGIVNREQSPIGYYIETEHDFWQTYIYFGFVFFVIELLYALIMFRAYYCDKARRIDARNQKTTGNFAFSFSGASAPPGNTGGIPPPYYPQANAEPLVPKADPYFAKIHTDV